MLITVTAMLAATIMITVTPHAMSVTIPVLARVHDATAQQANNCNQHYNCFHFHATP
jgi:hypothetical protein